jgi:hypothetical protein
VKRKSGGKGINELAFPWKKSCGRRREELFVYTSDSTITAGAIQHIAATDVSWTLADLKQTDNFRGKKLLNLIATVWCPTPYNFH